MDMIQFARLVSFVSVKGNTGTPLDQWEIEVLRDLCAALVAPPASDYATLTRSEATMHVQSLIVALADCRRIDAIKAYRRLDHSAGLKEAKDMIESVTNKFAPVKAWNDD